MVLVMGILNVTPDSFSDGGRHHLLSSAIDHAGQLLAEGADLIDIGGESTRPGAQPVHPAEETRRVMPVFEELFLRQRVPVSLDTRHPETARAALQLAGDRAAELIINDVSGLLTDPQMPQLVAHYGCEIVVTHNRGDSMTMQQKAEYDDAASPALLSRLEDQGVAADQLADAPGVLVTVLSELADIRQRYVDAGVAAERIILDPGIGFAKTHQQNWELIRNLHRFTELQVGGVGHRVLFGASRKGFLGALLTDGRGSPRPADRRDSATAALSHYADQSGCWAVRVHAPQPTADVLRVISAVGGAGSSAQRMPE